MNCLNGHIIDLSGVGNLTIVRIKVDEVLFSAIVIGRKEDDTQMVQGREVEILFNESEVVIGKNIAGKLSMGNSVGCIVKSMENGKVFSRVGLDLHGFTIYSLMATEVCNQMDIHLLDEVEMFVRMNDVFLQYPE